MKMKTACWWPALLAALMMVPMAASAVPSFARQTGLSCAMCHTVFPQLTPFGRTFKLNGYTEAGDTSKDTENLSEDLSAPMAAMLEVSYASWNKSAPGTSHSGAAFPDQFSLFYAGRITSQMGAFVQATLSGSDSFSMDNADVRWAQDTKTADGKDLIYGISLNNAPTVEDILNTTPVWAAFPSATGETEGVPAPAAGTLLGGDVVNQQSLGAVAYAMYDNHWYGAAGLYRNTNADTTADGLLGWAPYVRAAYQQDDGVNNWDIGLVGFQGNVQAVGTTGGPSDKYTDTGIDAQFQRLLGNDTLTVRAAYIAEKRNNDYSLAGGMASNSSDNLHNANLSVTYFKNRRIGGSLGYFTIGGDSDTALWGGSPDSNYWMAEADYVPWLNTKFSLQYTAYGKFDGATSGASDNNTLYALAWFMF